MPTPEKLDFKKLMKPYWAPPAGKFTIVDVPDMQFAMVDGAGDPNTAPAYAEAVQWLYAVSYGAKFTSKAAGKDYSVAPLEGLWWADDWNDFVVGNRANWRWTMMIMLPDWITAEMFAAAVVKAGKKLGAPPASLRRERFAEGRAVQIMHIGPYSAEGPTIAKLHGAFLPENGLTANGHHHEIYLGDPRQTAPEKLKTVLRQPVRPATATASALSGGP